MSSVTFSLTGKLNEIAGKGSLKEREARVRSVLNWDDREKDKGKAKSAIRHLLAGEQKPSLDEAFEIEEAFQKIERQKHELLKIMQAGLSAMENSQDADFYAPHIDAVRRYMFPGGNLAGKNGGQD